jgi:hypothetical protein
MKICKCGETIPEKRAELGYTTCVECSTTKKFSGHLVVHHKTGNEYEVIRDPGTANEVRRMTRAGFGARRKGGNYEEKTPRSRKLKPVEHTESTYVIQKISPDPKKWKDEEWGIRVMEAFESSKEEARELLEKIYQSGEMSPDCRKRIIYLMENA